MTPYKMEDDGSILFESPPVGWFSSTYSVDPVNPCRYIPKYESCSKRRLELKVMKCGRKVADWNCVLYNQGVSVSFCRVCGVPADEKRRQADTSQSGTHE